MFGATRSLPGSAATAPGERIYAIGDVHGRYDLLRALFDKIETHTSSLGAPRSLKIIILGDVIDRGPDSARVLQFLSSVQRRTNRLTVLMGNHEEMLLRVLDGYISVQRPWLSQGGLETLESLGVPVPADDDPPSLLAERLREALPGPTVQWLRTLPLTARSGDYLFCHAGIRPGVSVKRQARADLLWIRDEFLDMEEWQGVVVVHGHSQSPAVEFHPNRIGVDTGAYRTDTLSAVYLEDAKREVIAT